MVAFFWAGYLVLEGFDFGVGMLLPFLPRTDAERSVMFQSIGPVWDGNEVWLVVAGGATFAAFPAWYGTMFSGFYIALLLILVFLILRVVSFEWREKASSPGARRFWMSANAAGSFGIALIWGIGLSNVLRGIPINSTGDATASFWDLFSAYTVVGGLAFVALFAFHGAGFLTLRTTGDLHRRASRAARRLAIPAVILVIGYVVWTLRVAVDSNDKDLFPPVVPAAIAIAAIILAALLVHTGRRSGLGVRAQRRRHGRRRRHPVHLAVPARDGLEHRLREQPHRVRCRLRPLHPGRDDGGGADRHPGDPRLPGLDLPRLPPPPRRRPAGRRGTRAGSPDGGLMRTLDRRLVRRARAVRRLLAADVLLGLGTTALILAQATLLASVVARAFAGAPPRDLSTDVVLLAAVFALRGGLAWGFEVAGRRAAATTQSGLRLELAERRLRDRPAALDGAEAAEIATAGVQGVDGLEAYFGRYLPQLVLAALVPLAVLGRVAWIDPLSAGVMLLTLPLVPVFMWLIGRATQQRARERWQALRFLSSRFLDVVRGLPTLRAYNRGRAETAALEDAGERYRRATMGTLRIAFLSGSVLELAATLGVALVAVIVGVRLVDGGVTLQAALTVLVLAPELYAPLRQLAAQFHASADGLAAADRILELLDEPAGAADGPPGRAEPRGGGDPVRGRRVHVPVAVAAGRDRRRLRAGAGRDGRPGGREWRGQEHPGGFAARADDARRGPHHDRRLPARRLQPRGVAPARRLGAAAAGDPARHRGREHPAR